MNTFIEYDSLWLLVVLLAIHVLLEIFLGDE